MKSSFWDWVKNPSGEAAKEASLPEAQPAPPKPIGIREIALGVYCGLLLSAATTAVIWFFWTVFSDAARR